jgi:hypothetical protein
MQRMFLKVTSMAVAASAVIAGALGVASATAAPHAQAAKSGRISVLIVAHGSGKSYDIVTGAIADYGTDHDGGHNSQKVVLSKGTFELAAGDFSKNFTTKTDKTTCAEVGSSHAANLRISHGTGAYAKITGTVAIKGTFFELLKKSAGGKCEDTKAPISASDVITGSGTVSY